MKHGTEVTLRLSSNLVGDSIDKTNILHELLLTDWQVSKLLRAFAYN